MSGLTLKGLEPLFYSLLAVFELEGAAELNTLLLAEARALRAASPGITRSNWQGWHSTNDFFERGEPGCVALRAHIIEALRQCTLAVAPQFELARFSLQTEGWINVLGRGGFNIPHDHPNWTWSGTYYVHVPPSANERSGCIEFIDTRTNARTLAVDGAACFTSKFVLQPRAGMLLIFPAYLRHWVHPNEEDAERVSVAFNARFTALP